MLVSIIIPCRNEAGFIERFVASALEQERRGFELELLVAEGQSDDGTAAILASLARQHSEIRVIDNPGRIVSTGLNRAIDAARGEVIARMDVHTSYDPDYVAQCVAALQSSGAGCVGGPWLATGQGRKQAAIADAFQSPVGSGGAASRRLDYDGPCDTVYLGCWWKKDLVNIGGFDELLVRNQDDELCLRLKLAGHTIWQSSKVRSRYNPRASFRALTRQFFQYGYWKVAVAKKHKQHASLRHMLPFLFVSGLFLLLVASIFNKLALVLLLAAVATYTASVLLAASFASRSMSPGSIASVAWSIACMHFAYGSGYALGIRDFRLSRGLSRNK